MNITEIHSYEEQAVDTVVLILNQAKEKLGERQTLRQLAHSRDFAFNPKVSLNTIRPPYAITTEKFINNTIEHDWKLGETFMYVVKYLGASNSEVTRYFYFEAVFSQPTITYPIPQTQVSVFFRLEDKLFVPLKQRGAPSIIFRVEGQYTEHDIRFVTLTADWILSVIKMKIDLFQRIEAIRLF